MRFHKIVLAACMFSSIFLFLAGLNILAHPYSPPAEKKPIAEYSPVRTEQPREEKPVQAVEPINILLLGLDGEEVRSDVMILLNFSPEHKKLNILSIARDTKVKARNRTSKINALIRTGGEKLVMEKVEEITGLPVHYYATLNFKGFRKVIDTLDGVEMNVPFDMDYDDPEQNLYIHLKKGRQVLNGKKAEQLVRYRKGNKRGQGYIDGDIGRIKMQQEFIKGLITQKAKLKYISKADDIYLILRKHFKSNITLADISSNLKNMTGIKYEEIKTYTLPGESAYTDGIWYFIYNKKETRKLIDENFFTAPEP